MDIVLLFSGIGVIYISRFWLRKFPKMTSDDLKQIDISLRGIHQTYMAFSTGIGLLAAIFLFFIYQMNKDFWDERVLILAVPFFVVFALFDAVFALYTQVFPTTTKYNWNSYVYDSKGELKWVAWWQIRLAMFLLVADAVMLVVTM